MNKYLSCLLLTLLAFATSFALADHHEHGEAHADDEGWISLFNGKDLAGWKINENPETFRIDNGTLIVRGDRGHMFYVGEVANAKFKNFEWKCEILTKPKANSGMYFHTKWQDDGWPSHGYEVQVNQTHHDKRKTGGLYDVKDVLDQSPVKDNEWFTQHVIVKDRRVVVKVNGEVTCDYTEPENYKAPANRAGRKLSSGTIAIQGHDPGSEIHYRKIMVKLLD